MEILKTSNSATKCDPYHRQNVSRFVSSLAAAFRSFYLYKQDNRAFEEILINLARRFQESFAPAEPIKIGITNRSFVYEGNVVGSKEISILLAKQLRSLGYKEIIIQSPIQNRHFFQLLHILSSKETDEQKNEKCVPLLEDGEIKPIALVPINSNLSAVRLSDQILDSRLMPLSIPADMQGKGFLEKMNNFQFDSVSDLLDWIPRHLEGFPPQLSLLVNSIVSATRAGYFPLDRFLRIFPLPRRIRDDFKRKFDHGIDKRPRRSSTLGHKFNREGRKDPIPPKDWSSHLINFTDLESKSMMSLKTESAALPASLDLDLARTLLQEQGPNFVLGLCLLLKYTNYNNPVAIQEKAIRISMEVWEKYQNETKDPHMTSLLGSLRQSLTAPHNLILCLDPLRQVSMESWEFKNIKNFVSTLGEVVLPGLIAALDTEQDRGMRKKICELCVGVAQQFGVERIITALPTASPFLLRNLVMVLGEIRNPLTLIDLTPLIKNASKIVRIEAVRAISKLGNEESHKLMHSLIEQPIDPESKEILVDQLSVIQEPKTLEIFLRLAKNPTTTGSFKRHLFKAIALLGKESVRPFFEQIQKESHFLSIFNSEQKEEMELVKSILGRNPLT